jgi:hypothetical protein
MHNERRRGQMPGHNDQVPTAHNERRRGQRPGATAKYLPATHNEQFRGQRLGHHDQVPARFRGSGLGITIKYLRGIAVNSLRTTMANDFIEISVFEDPFRDFFEIAIPEP